MSMASDSGVILQRLVSVTSDLLISTSTCCHTAIILISIFLAILGSDLCSCYLPTTPTLTAPNHVVVFRQKTSSHLIQQKSFCEVAEIEINKG